MCGCFDWEVYADTGGRSLSDLHQLGLFKILIHVYAVILARNTMVNMTIREVRLNVFVF